VFTHTTLTYVFVLGHFLGMVVLLTLFVIAVIQGMLLLALVWIVVILALLLNLSRLVRSVELTPRGISIHYWMPNSKTILWEELRQLEIREEGSQTCVITTPSGLTFLRGLFVQDLPRLMKTVIEQGRLEYAPNQTGQAIYRSPLRRY
jgi:hypothetical protein